jgi:hypothetical protein
MRRMMYECKCFVFLYRCSFNFSSLGNPNLDRVNTPFTQGQYTYRCVTWNIFAS